MEVGIVGDAIADNQHTVVEVLLGAESLPGMRNAAAIELHGIGIEACEGKRLYYIWF